MRRADRRLGLALAIALTGLRPRPAVADTHVTPPGTITLGEAYRLALRQSEQVQIAVGNRDIAETNYVDQLTIMGPTITGNVRGLIQNNARGQNVPGLPPGAGLQSPYFVSTTATIAQPLFRRQIFDARRAAKLGIQSNDLTLQRTRQQLMFDTATVFIGVLQARQQVAVGEAAVKRADQSLAAATKRLRAGAAIQSSVLLPEIELRRAQASVNAAEGNARLQESAFERLVGQAPPAALQLPTTPSREALAEAMRRAHEDRADLRALHYATLQSKALVSQLQGRIFWPTLDATFTGGYILSSPSNGGPDFRYPTYGVTGVLTIPLFQTGDEWLQVRLQKQRTFIAAYQESFLRRQIGDDVRQALARLQTADKAIAIAIEQQKVAQLDYQAVSSLFSLGQATPLDVITAQAAVFEADTNRAIAQFERELATYQLLFAEGQISL